jgi:hypothetical protein
MPSTVAELNAAFDILFGSTGDVLSREEASVVRRALSRAVKEAEAYGSQFHADFDRFQRLFDCRHFSNMAVAQKEPSYVVLNELGNHIRYLAAWLTDRSPRLRVFPASAATTEEAAYLMRRVLTSYFIANRMKSIVRAAYEDALVFGSGFVRWYWDPFDEAGLGALVAEAVPPYHVFPGEGCDRIQDGPYFVVRRYVDTYEKEQTSAAATALFGSDEETVAYDLAARAQGGVQIGEYTTVETSPFFTTSKREVGLEEDHKELEAVYDIWVRRKGTEGIRWYKVTTDLRFVYPPLQVYADLPFAHYRFQAIRSRRFYGQGLCEILYYPQRVLDEIASMINRQIHFTADPVWVEEAGARDTGRPGRKRVKPGQVIFVQDGYKGRVGFESPPQLQGAQFEMVSLMLSYFERVTGMNAFMRGATPSRREAVGVAEAMTEASQVLVRALSDDFEAQTEEGLTGAAGIVASSILAGRRMYLVEDESPELYIDLPDYPFYTPDRSEVMKFRVHFESGSSMAVSREARAATALRLYAATSGILGPEWLARELGVDGAAEQIAEAMEKQEQKQQLMAQSIVAAAQMVNEAARKVIGGPNAEDQERRTGEAGVVGSEEPLGQGEGINRGEGRSLPDELRGRPIEEAIIAAAGPPQ